MLNQKLAVDSDYKNNDLVEQIVSDFKTSIYVLNKILAVTGILSVTNFVFEKPSGDAFDSLVNRHSRKQQLQNVACILKLLFIKKL